MAYVENTAMSLCQIPVSISDTGYVSVHVQIRSKRPSWNVAQQVTHTIDGFQDPFNQISLNAQLGPNAQLSMNTSAILCYSNLFFFLYFALMFETTTTTTTTTRRKHGCWILC